MHVDGNSSRTRTGRGRTEVLDFFTAFEHGALFDDGSREDVDRGAGAQVCDCFLKDRKSADGVVRQDAEVGRARQTGGVGLEDHVIHQEFPERRGAQILRRGRDGTRHDGLFEQDARTDAVVGTRGIDHGVRGESGNAGLRNERLRTDDDVATVGDCCRSSERKRGVEPNDTVERRQFVRDVRIVRIRRDFTKKI